MTDRLYPGQRLVPQAVNNSNNTITSPSNRYRLTLQVDGNLVLYDDAENSKAIWSSRTNGQAVAYATMQSDGNFVIYGFPNPLWATNTSAAVSTFLQLQDDGNLVVYEVIEPVLWNSGSGR